MTTQPSAIDARAGADPWPMAGVVVALACLALGGISALEMRHVTTAHGHATPWSLVLAVTMPRWILLATALPFVLRVGVSSSPPRFPPGVVAAHIVLFLIISVPHAAVTAWTTGLASPVAQFFPASARLARAWYSTMPTMASLYGAVLIAAWAMAEAGERERRTLRASQLEAQLQTARLATLRAKLQPHFLYNTLNGIAALVAGAQPERAVRAIEQLSELLHVSLRHDGREEITVAEEIALAQRYLALQRMRFGTRLRSRVDVADDAADCLVPVLLLQPIVENAVVHGLDAGASELQVVIVARTTSAGLELRVENDGTTLAPDFGVATGASGSGVGIAATRARLATAFGDRASLRLLPRHGGGAVVRIELPRSVRGGGGPPDAIASRPMVVS